MFRIRVTPVAFIAFAAILLRLPIEAHAQDTPQPADSSDGAQRSVKLDIADKMMVEDYNLNDRYWGGENGLWDHKPTADKTTWNFTTFWYDDTPEWKAQMPRNSAQCTLILPAQTEAYEVILKFAGKEYTPEIVKTVNGLGLECYSSSYQ